MNRYLRHLIRLFLKAETDIINEITLLRAKGNVDYHAVAALARVQKILRNLEAEGWEYVPKMIEMEFYVSHPEARRILEPVEKHIAGYENAIQLTSTQTKIAEILTRNLMEDVQEACDTSEKNLRAALSPREALEAVFSQEVGVDGRKQFLNQLAQKGVTAFTDRMGRDWRLSAYADMVLRTTAAQAQTLATLTNYPNRDLFQITVVGSTCPVCAPLEGRVYSLSGKDPDFPPLASAFGKIDPDGPNELENTWLNIHPNCAHAWVPFTFAGKTQAEIEEIKRFSSFETNPVTHDPRSEEQIAQYREKQRLRAKYNEDWRQWERYKVRLGDKIPSFATFMKHKTQNDSKYQEWLAMYRAA